MQHIINKYGSTLGKTTLVFVLSFSVILSGFQFAKGSDDGCSEQASILRGTILDKGESNGIALARVENPSPNCSFDVGFASYKMPNFSPDPREAQQLFDSQTARLEANQTILFQIKVPDCHFQLDLFRGPVLKVPVYEPVALAYEFGHNDKLCVVLTPAPTQTPAPTSTPVPTQNPTPVPTPTNHQPIGVFDAVNCNIIGGWAFDEDNTSASVVISIYKDGPPGMGTLLFSGATTGFRPDVNATFGISGNHGYTIFTPESVKNGTHEIWITATDANTGQELLLTNRQIVNFGTCVTSTPTPTPTTPPTPTPTPTQTPTPTPTNTPAPCNVGTIQVHTTNSSLNYQVNGPNGVISGIGNQTFTNQAIGTYNIGVTNSPNTVVIAPTTNLLLCNSTVVFNITVINSTPTPTPTITPNPAPNSYLTLSKWVRNVTAGGINADYATANNGDTVEFTINAGAVVNSGSATNVRVVDALPAGLQYINGSTRLNGSSVSDSLVSGGLNLGTLYNANNATINFRATVNTSSATLTNNATIYADNLTPVSDPAYVNVNQVQVNAMSISKFGKDITRGQTANLTSFNAQRSDTLEFVVIVSAPSNTSLNNVIVTDQLPAGLTYIANTTSLNGTIIANGITSGGVNIGSLSNGQQSTIRFNAKVDAGVALNQTLTNIAYVRADNAGQIQSNPVYIQLGYTPVINGIKVKTGLGDMLYVMSLLISLGVAVAYNYREKLPLPRFA